MPVMAAGFGRDEGDAPERAARRYFEWGRAALPEVSLDYDAFERYFARHDAHGGLDHAPDMVLACACAERVKVALVALEEVLTSDVARALTAIDASPAFIEDTLQATRERLLVAKGGEPARIATYAGRASLRSWLCAIAVRIAVSQRRRRSEQRQRPLGTRDAEPLARGGPDIDYTRQRYKDCFEDAIRAAIGQLTPRERLLLRLNVIDGMSIDQLGAMYNVGRSTAARWLAAARRSLHERARREVHVTLGITSAELDSLAGELQSQIDVSVLKLLGNGKS